MPIVPPDRAEWGDYVRSAVLAELKLAEAHSNDAGEPIEGTLNDIIPDASRGRWSMRLSLKTPNGRTVSVASVYDSPTAGDFLLWPREHDVCDRARDALVPAVQDLVGRVLQHPEFPSLAAK